MMSISATDHIALPDISLIPDPQLRALVNAFQSVTHAVTSQLDQDLVLINLVEQMTSLLQVEGCSISRYEPEREAIVTIAEQGPDSWLNPSDEEEVFYLRDYEETAEVIHSQQSWQYTKSALVEGQDERVFLEQYGHQSALLVPMIYQGRTWGLIEFVQFSYERVFTEWEIKIGELLATQGAVALANAHLFAQTRQQIEEMRILKRAAEASDMAKTRFLTKMTHELRTPLNVIIGSGEYLQEEIVDHGLDKGDYDLIEPVDDLLNSANSLLKIVNDVLSYSKMEIGELTLSTRPLSLKDLINDLVLIGDKLAVDKSISFQYEVHGEQAVIESDPHMLREILINLLGNAFKFTEEGSVILIVDIVDAYVQFVVRDTGIGMNDAQLASLFQPFLQAEEQYNRMYSGTGLGLALCQRYATLLNGQLLVESQLGQGSIFTLIVPKTYAK